MTGAGDAELLGGADRPLALAGVADDAADALEVAAQLGVRLAEPPDEPRLDDAAVLVDVGDVLEIEVERRRRA